MVMDTNSGACLNPRFLLCLWMWEMPSPGARNYSIPLSLGICVSSERECLASQESKTKDVLLFHPLPLASACNQPRGHQQTKEIHSRHASVQTKLQPRNIHDSPGIQIKEQRGRIWIERQSLSD